MSTRAPIHYLFLIFFGMFISIQGQIIPPSTLIIKDHNDNKSPITIDCDYNFNENHKISLKAEYPEIKNTTKYSVTAIPFNPVGNFSEGEEVMIESDDKWSNVQNLPFKFCFYGNTYSSIILGDNGVLCFDTQYAGTECPYVIAGAIPNQDLMHNTIFGAYHDMTNDSDVFGCTNDCGKISMYTTGTMPFRKTIINYYNMNHFGCESSKSTLQIVLYETTNIIEIYIKNKPLTCEIGNEKRTLIGITNSDGSQGIAPQSRNTGIWEAYNEAWRFSPEGTTAIPSVEWKDSNQNLIPSSEVSPKSSTTYYVNVSYAGCTPVTLSDEFQIIFSPDYPKVKDLIVYKCFEGNTPNAVINLKELMLEASEANPDVTTSLHLNIEEANTGANPITDLNTYLITENSKSFYLRASKNKDCYSTSVITLHLKRKPNLKETEPIIICGNEENNDSEIIYLKNYEDHINGYENWMNLDYFDSYNNALEGVNPISTLSLSSTVTIYAKASNKEYDECFSIIPVTFKFQKTIISQPQKIILCDENLNGREIYNLRSYESTLTNYQNLSFTYYNYETDALQNINPILNPESYTVTNGEVIYVSISSPGYCSSINTISFSFKNSAVKNMHKYVCDGKLHEIKVNLLDYYNDMKRDQDIILDGIYNSWEGAINKDLSQKINDLVNFTVVMPYSIVYVRFFDNTTQCEYIREIKLEIRAKIEKIPSYNVCDLNNSGESHFNLNTLRPIFMAGYPPSSIAFYETLEDYNNETNPITETIVKREKIIYVKINVNDECKYYHKINLKLKELEASETQKFTICDSENDGKENFNLNDLITLLNLSDYSSIQFYKSEKDAFKEINPIANKTEYPISISNKNIFVRSNYNKSCPSIIPVEIELFNSIIVPNFSSIEICDKENKHSKTVDLTRSVAESGINTTKISVEYYLTSQGAEQQNNNEKILDPTSFTIYNTTTVFIRFTNIDTHCYQIRPLKIKLNPFPQVVKLNLNICDFNNDQVEDVTLNDLNPHLVNDHKNYSFSYYLSEKDAINNINKILRHAIKNSTELYVKISSGNECQVIHKLGFTLQSSPLVHNKTIKICDNNSDDTEIVDLTQYNDILVDNVISTFKFTYFTSFNNAYDNSLVINNAKEYAIQKFPTTLYVRISNSSGCFSIAELTFHSAEKILAQNKDIHICDEGSDMQEYINLNSYISEVLLSPRQNLLINYYKTEKGANDKNENDRIKNPDHYSVTLAKDYVWIRIDNPATGCYTVRYLEIILEPLPKLINSKYLICDTDLDGIYKLDLDQLRYAVIFNPEGYTFSYYYNIEDAKKDANRIENIHQYTVNDFNQKIVIKATNKYGCSSIRSVTLYTKDKIKVNTNSIEMESCDDDFDGLTLFNLTTLNSSITKDPKATFEYFRTLSDAKNQINPIKDPYNYKNIVPHLDKVYIRVSSPDYCPSLSQATLKALPVPVSNLGKNLKICPNGSLELVSNTNNPEDFYEWNTGEKGYNKHTITIFKAGIYTVTISGKNGCSYTYTTSVTEYPKTKIIDLEEGNDYITVMAEGEAPLEYSMDNKNWQSHNTFYNLNPGIYTFYVRSMANGCFSTEKKGVLFKINNVITPNGDNFNEVWQLCGLEHFDSLPSHIKIFDRYGKVVFTQSSNSCFVWDGHYLGRPLPTTTYWYIINIADGRQFTGWIVLRNHNNRVDLN